MQMHADFTECLACSCFAARRTARTITQHYERHLKPSRLRVSQFTMLTLLAITPKGATAAARALPHWRQAQRSLARSLGAGAVRALATASNATAEMSHGRR